MPAAQAYGERRPDLCFPIPKERFPEEIEPRVGQELGLQQPGGRSVPVRVVEIAPDTVTLDANHPLAGRDLTFEIHLEAIGGS